jgi:hypothetical protein
MVGCDGATHFASLLPLLSSKLGLSQDTKKAGEGEGRLSGCRPAVVLNYFIVPASSSIGVAAPMSEITREQLHAYLDECLPDADTARIEQALRGSESLRQQLRLTMQERDRGEHSLGAIWRRERITCPSREQLGSYLLEALDPDLTDYVAFHLDTICCPGCRANLADLKALQEESAAQAQQRRRRIFKSSAGLLTRKPRS